MVQNSPHSLGPDSNPLNGAGIGEPLSLSGQPSLRSLELKGTPYQIGLRHGQELSAEIRDTAKVYFEIFQGAGASREDVLNLAESFSRRIELFGGKYLAEMQGIADGAKMDLREIVALNSRTEILTTLKRTKKECTTIAFVEEGVLAQTWDWLGKLEGKPVLLKIEQDGHKLITMTEPGIIGKVGVNSAGLGVALNILISPEVARGVPIHVLLRSALDSTSWEEAYTRLTKSEIGTNSSITLASDQGRAIIFEYLGGAVKEVYPQDNLLVHTNHYLSEELECPFIDSLPRFKRATELLGQNLGRDVPTAMAILADRSDGAMSVCNPWHEEDFGAAGAPNMQRLGTLCTLVMDLKNKTLYVTKGHPGGVTETFEDGITVRLAYDAHRLD